MAIVDPAEIFRGRIMVAAPHMDDGVLACGGTLAALPDKGRIHVVYATDGSRSPTPQLPWLGSVSADLPAIRAEEARQALSVIGIPRENVRFLNFPDGRLRDQRKELEEALRALMIELSPDVVLSPFRFDRHADHLALYRAIVPGLPDTSDLYEYFVYYRWQLVAGRDLRNYVRKQFLLSVDIQSWSDLKQQALNQFISQTTCFFDWQERPILPPRRIAEVSQGPEIFLRTDLAPTGFSVFARARIWLAFVFVVEPVMKQIKDLLLTLMRQLWYKR